MDEDEQNRYVAQLKEEFDSCDTTGTGYLDKEELTALCCKLSLDAHLPILLDSLLGPQHFARVNFEEFKEGFVAVLSRSLDLSTSEEESSYLEPAVPEEVKPKFVKGTKRYGRKSRPDKASSLLTANGSGDSPPFRADQDATPCPGGRRAKLRRSTSLESVESLKSDEDPGSSKHSIQYYFEAQGQLKRWKPDSSGSPSHSTGPSQEVTDGEVTAVWEELGVGSGGSLNKKELSLVCEHIGLKDLQSEELDALFRKLDRDQDGRVSLSEFQSGLLKHEGLPGAPAVSTPTRPQRPLSQAFEERSVRSISPSLLSATVGQRLLSRLDDGSGCSSPEKVAALWTEEGIRNSKDILQTLDFPLEERLSLAELALALDNELLVSDNGIHQAALISYKDEIQFLHGLVNQACQERDKVKTDLELIDRRNLQLIREIDDRHATMESLNESKIKDLELDFRDKLSALRTEAEQETEVLLQQAKREQAKLEEEVELLRAREASLQEEAASAIKENSRLEEEIADLKGRLTESESSVSKLRRDLDCALQDKYGDVDQHGAGLSPEEHLLGIIKEYELQCRELQDRNDELNSEIEILKSRGLGRRTRRTKESFSIHSWSSRRTLTTDSDSDDPEMKRGKSPQGKKGGDKNALGSLENLAPTPSIETELAMERLKEQHQQEVQDLKIQLETKVNFYERTIEFMKQNMEVERKDIAQGYKVEISELEEQKALTETRVEQLRLTVQRLEGELKVKGEGVTRDLQQEQRWLREQAELEQNYAREIGNIVQRLAAERDQLEAELKLKMDQEVLRVRAHLDEVNSENSALKDRLAVLHQDVTRLEEDVNKKRKKLEEIERGCMKIREEDERLQKENSKCREEVLNLSARNLQLSNENAELNSRLHSDQEEVRRLSERLARVCQEQKEADVSISLLQETSSRLETEKLQLKASTEQDKDLLEKELKAAKDKLQRLTEVESALTSLTLKNQLLQKDNDALLKDVEERNKKLEELQVCIVTLETQEEQLRSQLNSMQEERDTLLQDMATRSKLLKESQEKVVDLETNVHKLRKESEQLQQVHRIQEQAAASALQGELRNMQLQNQELLNKVATSESKLQTQEMELQKLKHECITFKSKWEELEIAKNEAEEQAFRANAVLSLSQAQHVHEVEKVRDQVDSGAREQLSRLQAQLSEQQSRTRELEEQLSSQTQQAKTHLGLQQEQYEKVLEDMQERMEELETKLKSERLILQEKINQLKQQMAKNAKSDLLLKDLYVENSQLMKALQVTEQRQKSSEKKSFLLEEKVNALNKLLHKIAPASLSA
ncbi:ninein-like protein isoform X5 [Brachyhypopomus gauderio]|uniref:ninein-like protein isoform X5 n=1 Tax=Brachyhypopomus gauderio TaxID=698409 RepID=UPI0040419AB2